MKLGLVIDLDVCVGCQACAVACKQWNTSSGVSGPLPDYDPYGAQASGVWFNRVRNYEVGDYPHNKTVNMPLSCMHCADPACVEVCPTGASFKREDGIVLVDHDKCMGCSYCSWACPYGARELDRHTGVMKKCTLCVDRIYDQALPEAERQPSCVMSCPAHARHFGDFDDAESNVSKLVRDRQGMKLMPELGYKPTNTYLPPREARELPVAEGKPGLAERLKNFTNRLVRR